MRINSSGNVGIGTSSPSYRFDVSGASASGIARFANAWGDGTNPAILVDGTGGDGRLVQIKSGGTRSWPLLWVTASTTDVLVVNGDSTIKTAGTISVGGATPSTSGAGITFPATQSASTDANTLDDYEEGTWTPVVTSTGGTYANQAGRYTKVGRVVTCDFFVQNASTFTYASLSAFFTITGLPFTPTSWSYNGVTGTVWTQGFNYNNDQSASVKFVTPVATSSATILFKTSDSAATAGTIINSNNSGFIITGQVIFTV
jgi:hypothetical protein